MIGAGAVGLEFASIYRSFGAEVTVVEALPRLAPLEDEEVSKEIAKAFRKRGIAAFAGVGVLGVRDTGAAVDVTYDTGGATRPSRPTCAWSRSGAARSPRAWAWKGAGVGTSDRGFVKVDGQLQTNAPHVWAVGDVAATPLQLAHVSFTEGMAVAERIAGIEVADIDYVNIPKVTYCTPEMASVGLTEGAGRGAGPRDRDREARLPRDRQGQHPRRGRFREGRGRGGRRPGAWAST